MQSREKEKHRNFFGDERGVVARGIAAGEFSTWKLEIFLRGSARIDWKRRARADAADVHLVVRMRPIMSMLSMATALSSGRVGSFTHSAEPSRPSSSPAKDANKIPRGSWPLSGASRRASSSTPAVPEALSSAPG